MDDVNRAEIYRYLGIKGSQEPDPMTRELVEDCLGELEKSVNCRSFCRSFPLSILPDSELDFTCFKVRSKALSRNLKDCHEVILFAATLGAGVDLLLRRYNRISMSRAVVMQACAAARIEKYCNEINDKLKARAADEGLYLRPRFSPGYGDLPISCQPDFCRVLEAEKTVGITLTESFLMIPSKSVTAVIGVSHKRAGCVMEGCEACSNKNCLYRRDQ